MDVELTAKTKSFGGVADIFKGVNRSSIDVELTATTKTFDGVVGTPKGINRSRWGN